MIILDIEAAFWNVRKFYCLFLGSCGTFRLLSNFSHYIEAENKTGEYSLSRSSIGLDWANG